jgi:hypothetical protein
MSRPAVTGDPAVSHPDDAVVLLALMTEIERFSGARHWVDLGHALCEVVGDLFYPRRHEHCLAASVSAR